MSLINLSLILVSLFNVFLSILVINRNYKNRINISFAILILMLAGWTFGMAMFRQSSSYTEALFWIWMQNLNGSLLVMPFFMFSLYFPYQYYKLSSLNKFFMVVFAAVMVGIVFVPGAWLNQIIINPPNNENSLNPIGLSYFAVHFYFYIILTFYIFFKKYKVSDGVVKRQLLFLILSTGITTLFGSFFGVILPLLTRELGLYWMGPFFSLPMILVLMYFIFKN